MQRRKGQELRPIAQRKGYGLSALRNDQGQKWCPSCERWLDPAHFSPDKTKADGLVQWCRPCSARYKLEWRYGLQRGQLAEMLVAQGNVCAICETSFAETRVYVDHDHACCPHKGSCGKCIRGLLCNRCNIVAGFLTQNDGAKVFFDYLERYGQ